MSLNVFFLLPHFLMLCMDFLCRSTNFWSITFLNFGLYHWLFTLLFINQPNIWFLFYHHLQFMTALSKINNFPLLKKLLTEAVAKRCSVKKVFLEIFQNSQQNTCATGLRPATLLKKTLWHRCFPVNFVKFLRTPFLTEHLWSLLLY